MEAELPFIDFDDLLDEIEDLVVDTTKRVFEHDKELLLKMNPKACIPKKPFKRMKYSDCIQFCRDHNIYKIEAKDADDGKPVHFKVGDDIPDYPERKMINMIGEPVFMTYFPVHIKSFYMNVKR